MGGQLPPALAVRQDRALHARRELHRVVQLEGLRQERAGHLGNPADRLPAHAARPAEPRAARLPARRQLLLVPVQRQPAQVPADAQRAAQALARGAQGQLAGRSLGEHRRGPGEGDELQEQARHGGLRARGLGRSQRADRGRQPVHREAVRPGSRDRFLADPGHVDGVLCRWRTLPVAVRRRLPLVLRLVLRPAAVEPAGLGRADRRARVGRLVQLALHHRLGLERAPDPHAGRALLHRGALQRHQDRGDRAGLCRGRQAGRPLAAPEAGHRCGARPRVRPRDPARVPPRPAVAVLPGLLSPVLRHAAAGDARQARGRQLRVRPLPARQRPRRPRRGQQSGVEDARLRRDERRPGRAERLGRLPLGRAGQVEHRGARQPGPADAAAPEPRRRRRRRGAGGLSVLRRWRQ